MISGSPENEDLRERGTMMKSILVVLMAAWSILLVGSLQNFAPAELPVDLCQITQSFDREACEAECRSIYGVDGYGLQRRGGRSGGDSGTYYLYARCIQNCNDRFWKEFDREHQ